MPSSDEPAPASPLFTLFMIVALLAVWGLIVDVIHTSEGGSIDLRNRITGVRLAAEKRDPYTFKWTRREDDRFCDPFTFPSSPVSHTTVTPLTLTAFLPLKNLPYRVSQWCWLVVEYSCLGLGFWAWARHTHRRHWLWGGLLTFLYCLSPHWRLHVDRGQSYVLYAALFLWLASIGTRGPTPADAPSTKRRLWMEGLGASLLAMLRPTYALLLGAGVLRRPSAGILATAPGLILWTLLPILLAGTAVWQNYFKAMAVHARLYLDQTKFPPSRFAASETIEGISVDTFLRFPRIPFSDTSIYKLLSFQLQPSLLLGTWAVLAAFAGFLFLRRGETGTPRFWWALSAWVLVGDYLLPAYRYPYNHILLWPLLLLGLNALPSGGPRTIWLGLGISLLSLHAATWFLPKACISWPGIATLLMAVGVALLSFLPSRKAPGAAVL